jgi:ankyrin repeat protein
MVAACNGHTAVASLLLDRGADINAANLVSYSSAFSLVKVMRCCSKEEMKAFFSTYLRCFFLSSYFLHRPFEITSESFHRL